MVVHQIPGVGGGVGMPHLPPVSGEDKEKGEEGEEKKDVIIEVLGDIGR